MSAFPDTKAALAAGRSVADLTAETFARAVASVAADEGIFVSLADEANVMAAARTVDERRAAGEALPLAGLPFTVKDNIDVAGLLSSGNVPGFGRLPPESAPVVDLAVAAGAVFVGKTTMDQFATGLNGTRANAPLCRNAIDPDIIPGGSSSGSAVAVARELCAFSLGSDTGGSGRVPAACNAIVGLKPTPGLLSGRGLLYCNRTFDVVPIFARTVADASAVLAVLAGPDPLDPFAFQGTRDPAPAPPGATLAVPRPADLDFFGDAAAETAHAENLDRLRELGYALAQIDFAPFREAGRLVFETAFVAERLVDYGDFIAASPDAVHPAVRTAIDAGRGYSAREAFEAIYRLAELKVAATAALAGATALVVPTIPRLFTVVEMLAEPMARNTVMGTYTYFANPLGLCAIAVPGTQRQDGLPSSISVVARGGAEAAILDIAARFAGEAS